jgi:hypothetical protein
MPSLTEIQAEAEAAHAAYAEAVSAASAATTHAAELREWVRSSKGHDVTSDALARADQAADHAALAVDGARCGLADLTERVQAARREELCDEIVTTVPRLGNAVNGALDAVSVAVARYVAEVAAYNAYQDRARARLNKMGATSSRVQVQRHTHPTVDRLSVAPAHGDRLLLAELLVPLHELGAPAFVLTELKSVAGAATPLPAN